jgi:hypothetical protein
MKTNLLIAIYFVLIIFIPESHAQQLTPFKAENEKFGYKSSAGEIIVPAKYEKVEGSLNWSIKQDYPFVKLNGKIGFLNSKGVEIIPAQYDSTTNFDYNGKIAMVKLNGKWGGIDTNGKNIIPFIYEESGSPYTIKEWPRNTIKSKYITSFVGVKKNGKWGFIDISGKERTPFMYESVENGYSSDPFFFAKLNGKWGIIDDSGKEIFPFEIDTIEESGELNNDKEYFKVRINGKKKKIILNQKTKLLVD